MRPVRQTQGCAGHVAGSDAASTINGQAFIVAGETIALCPVPRPRATVYRSSVWDAEEFVREASRHLLPHVGNLAP